MAKRRYYSLGTLAGIAMAVVASAAQDSIQKQDDTASKAKTTSAQKESSKEAKQKKTDTGKADKQDEGAKKGEGDKAEEEDLPVRWNTLSFGFNTWWAKDRRDRMFQYATAPSSLTLFELSLLDPGDEKRPYLRGSWYGDPGQDVYGSGRVILNRGHTDISASRSDHKYNVIEDVPAGESEDDVSRILVNHSLSPSAGAFFSYESRERQETFVAPKDSLHNRGRQFTAGLSGKLLGGYGSITLLDRRFFDDSGLQPATNIQRTVSAEYEANPTDSISLAGSAQYTQIQQRDRHESSIRSWGLSGNWDLAPSTSLLFKANQETLDLPVVLNAYDRKRFTSGVRLVQGIDKWTFQAGFTHQEVERVRSDQTFVDVPKWDSYDARLYGRLTDNIRLSLKGSVNKLRSLPEVQTQDNRSLFWSDQGMFQAKVDGGNDLLSGYASYTYRLRKNDDRDVQVGWHNFAVGGSYSITPKLLGYAEFARDEFKTRGLAETGVSLQDYFPASNSWTFGLDWMKDAKQSLGASMIYFETRDFLGSEVTFHYRRQISTDHSLDLYVAPWRFEDREFGLTGYTATFLQVRYTVKF